MRTLLLTMTALTAIGLLASGANAQVTISSFGNSQASGGSGGHAFTAGRGSYGTTSSGAAGFLAAGGGLATTNQNASTTQGASNAGGTSGAIGGGATFGLATSDTNGNGGWASDFAAAHAGGSGQASSGSTATGF
jgi:hypothetical protein